MYNDISERNLDEENVLCVASAYEHKFFFNEKYDLIPSSIKEELQIMCVLFTEDVGGLIILAFNSEGNLEIQTEHQEDDFLYDQIGSVLKIKELQREKEELFSALEEFYRRFICC